MSHRTETTPIHAIDVAWPDAMPSGPAGDYTMRLTPELAKEIHDVVEKALSDLRNLGPCPARGRFGEECQRQIFHEGKHIHTFSADGRSMSWEIIES